MKRGDMPAYPTEPIYDENGKIVLRDGLTIREELAKEFTKALISTYMGSTPPAGFVVQFGFNTADAWLAENEKREKQKASG